MTVWLANVATLSRVATFRTDKFVHK